MAIGSKLILEQCDSTHESPVESGKLLIRTDEGALYIDTDDGRRVRVGDVIQSDSIDSIIPQDGKIYKVGGRLYTTHYGSMKLVSDSLPRGTVIPFFGIVEGDEPGSGADLADFTKMMHLECPEGWRFCDGSVWCDCTLEPGSGDNLFYGDSLHLKFNDLTYYSDDTLVLCYYYLFYPVKQDDGTYDWDAKGYCKVERIGYIKSGNSLEMSDYPFVYEDYIISSLKKGNSIGLFDRLESLDILDHSHESENSDAISLIDETPFLIVDGDLYLLTSTLESVYKWKKKTSSITSTYIYTKISETLFNESNPMCYSNSSATTEYKAATYCFMRPFYPQANGGFYVMRGYLPNLNGRTPIGTQVTGDTGRLFEPTLPNITGTMNSPFGGSSSNAVNELLQGTGAIYEDTAMGTRYSAGSASTARRRLKFDASLSNPIYQDGATVRPPSFGVNWIIKIE